MGNDTVGLPMRIILTEGNEVEVPPPQELADILSTGGQSVVGGDPQDHRASVPQMGLTGEGHGAVGNAVCQLPQCIPCTGQNDQGVQQLLGA